MPRPSDQGKFPELHAFARAKLDAVLAEPLPYEWKAVLQQIHEREEHQSSRSDPRSDDLHKSKAGAGRKPR
jgi:hypothetical protein